MKRIKEYQYNQGVGKYKILSTTSGVGSIVPSTYGIFVMPLSISKWSMIENYQAEKLAHPTEGPTQWAANAQCQLISDGRFVEYLKAVQQVPNLEALIAVPHLNLDEYNVCDYKSHPLFKKWAKSNPRQRGERETDRYGNIHYIRRFLTNQGNSLQIPAIVFPRWFRSSLGHKTLMHIDDWEQKWNHDCQQFVREQNLRQQQNSEFVIPSECVKEDQHIKWTTNRDNQKVPVEASLEQVQMVLICPNGHISDIPWDKYFAAKLDDALKEGMDLFNYSGPGCNCNNGHAHKLQWQPGQNNPESYGVLKCAECGRVVSLKGIMNIRPKCRGEKPWVGDPNQRANQEDCDKNMRWALVTSNSVYYAESFNSLYVPIELLPNQITNQQRLVLEALSQKQQNWQSGNYNNDFWEGYLFTNIVKLESEDLNIAVDAQLVADLVDIFKGVSFPNGQSTFSVYNQMLNEYGIKPGPETVKLICIKELDMTLSEEDARSILGMFEQGGIEEMTPEKYRYDEYCVFMTKESCDKGKYLCFNDINLEEQSLLKKYFQKIKQFSSLAVSTTQLQFSRASSDLDEAGEEEENVKQRIFNDDPNDVVALPANQNFGEGLFFALNEERVAEFCKRIEQSETPWYQNLTPGDMGHKLLTQMRKYGEAKFYLLHTLSHIIMRELEFTCGYPTASLQERLYYSDRMCGFLIYTADGSEGSMGGLVAQGNPETISKIIEKAIDRAKECSSDPLCWDDKNQLNFAACFSCCMVSETSCEFGNQGLDRRALVDENFGFFKDLV